MNKYKLYRPSVVITTALVAVGVINLFRSSLSASEASSVVIASVAFCWVAVKWLRSYSPNTMFRLGLASLITFLFTSFFGICIGTLFPIPQPGVGIFSLCVFAAITFLVAHKVFETIFPDDKFEARQQILRKIILDVSALEDSRLVDLARSGLLDQRLAIPRNLTRELTKLSESQDENIRYKAKKALDAFKRIETLPKIDLEYFDLPDEDGDLTGRVIKTAKNLNAYVLSNETPLSRKDLEGVPCISIDNLASALKPAPQRGEFLVIKVLRLGKEPKQGVGYLDDGTMVVINGGGDYLGRNIRAQVLSQKHSSTGKIIFCNVLDVEEEGIAFS